MFFLEDLKEYIKYSYLNLEKLREAELYAKLKKYEFHIYRVNFLTFEIISHSVHIEKSRVDTIKNLPKLKAVSDVQIYFEFANFYQRFIF